MGTVMGEQSKAKAADREAFFLLYLNNLRGKSPERWVSPTSPWESFVSACMCQNCPADTWA